MEPLLGLQWSTFPLPVIDVLQDDFGRRLGGILATNTLDEVVIGICCEWSAM